MLRMVPIAGGLAILLSIGCDVEKPLPDTAAPVEAVANTTLASLATVNAAPAGNVSFFRFVTDTVTDLPAPNDASLRPEVVVCELTGEVCTRIVWSERKSIKASGKFFSADWAMVPTALDAAKRYRASVLLGALNLGSAEVAVVNNEAELARLKPGKRLGVVKGKRARLAFWISSSVFTLIGNGGGVLLSADKNAMLMVPRGAVTDAQLGIVGEAEVPAGALIVTGSYYQLMPPETQLAKAAHFSIRYDDRKLPEGVSEADLKLLHYANGAWSEVPDETLNIDSNKMAANIYRLGGYAVGVLASARSAQIELLAQNALLGAPVSAVLRLSGESATSSCTVALQRDGAPAPEQWVGPGDITLAGGECPFEGFVTRVGSYSFNGTIDGVTASSAIFPVSAPEGTVVALTGLPAGNFYAGSGVPTDNMQISVRDGAARPLANADVELSVLSGALEFDGNSQTTYMGRTNADGVITPPVGVWRLGATPGANIMRASLPGTSISATVDVTTMSGAPVSLTADSVPSEVASGTSLSLTARVVDSESNVVDVDDTPVTARLITAVDTIELGTVNTVGGAAVFNVTFGRIGAGNTIELSAPALASHTSNSFTITGPPAMPAFVGVTGVTTSSITLRFGTVSFLGSVAEYVVRVRPRSGGAYTIVSVLATTEHATQGYVDVVLNGLNAGTEYETSGAACDNYGCSDFTEGMLTPTVQPAPVSLMVTNLTSMSATLLWAAQSGPDAPLHFFEVYLTPSGGTEQLVTTTASNTAGLSSLTPNTGYAVRVRACNISGCSETPTTFTTLAALAPTAPTRLQINAQSWQAITLGWNDNSDNEDGFRVYRMVSPGSFVLIATLAASSSTYVDTDVFQGQSLSYRVDAFNTAGVRSSNLVSVLVPAGQSELLANYATPLTQTGTAGQAATYPPRVRLIDSLNRARGGVPVTFTITSAGSSFGTLIPRVTVVVVNTTSQGLATAPAWILEAGTNTVVATVTGVNPVTFTAEAN
ncbi:MAG TPA: fibronectin type III domain-containing protein [Longimicrobiales bacterium]